MADSNRRDIERGRIAQDILDNEIFQEAMKMLEDEREKLWMAMKLIPEFERQLRIIVEKGIIKKNQIVKIKKNIA